MGTLTPRLLTSLSTLLCLLCLTRLCSAASYEKALQEHLLSNYSSAVRPVLHDDQTVNVEIGLALVSAKEVDQVRGIVSCNVWVRLWWKDASLVWDKAQWNNINFTTFTTNPEFDGNIWIPDIYLYN